MAVKSVAASGADADVGGRRRRRHFLLLHHTMCEWKMHGLHLHSMTSNLILASNGKPPFSLSATISSSIKPCFHRRIFFALPFHYMVFIGNVWFINSRHRAADTM